MTYTSYRNIVRAIEEYAKDKGISPHEVIVYQGDSSVTLSNELWEEAERFGLKKGVPEPPSRKVVCFR